MNRRTFARLTGQAALLGAVPFGPLPAGGPLGRSYASPPDLRVDPERLNRRLAELARFGATAEGGTHRTAFSDEDVAAREWLSARMAEAGLGVRVDAAGNLVGRRPGRDGTLRPLLLGSHTDSVPQGGRYDGPVGSVAALEVASTLQDAGYEPHHPLEIVVWANEEGGKTGSRAIAGEMGPEELAIVTASGHTIGEGTRRIGGDPEHMLTDTRAPGSIAGYLELHIEQGAELERLGMDVGVVEGIVGIMRWTATVDGFANHAGTTPMDQRHDAMVAAARMIDGVERVARRIPGRHVATVGRIAAEPGAPNVIPGRVTFSLEIRDLEMEKIEGVFAAIGEEARGIAQATGTSVGFERFYVSRAAPTDPRFRDVIEAEAERLGLSSLRMPSGAGHDAQSVALLGPVGMIFVPSREGISHSPLEYTPPEQVTAGADVLLRSYLAVDERGL